MIRYLLPVAFVLLHFVILKGQVENPFTQTYDIPDGIKIINFFSQDKYELRKWNGVQMMIVTTARLDGGTMDLLSSFIAAGRYNFEFAAGVEGMTFRPKVMARPGVIYRERTCVETVKLVVYVPEEFLIQSNTELVRKEVIIAKGKMP